MCGIAGAWGFVDDRMAVAVRAMNDRQAHRGPDAQGFWRGAGEGGAGGVALAHRRLAILDLTEAGAQPMFEPNTGCVIVFNGEVFNYQDIRAELKPLGWSFHSDCDTEVILKAYAQWGPDCVKRFRGMFAYAIYDPRDPRKPLLHMARDRIGIKPIYYTSVKHGDGRATLLFASELRSILATGLVEKRMNPTALSTYLWHGFVAGDQSMVRGVKLLPQGTHVTLTVGDAAAGKAMPEPVRYWSIPTAQAAQARSAGDRDPVTALADELEKSVKLRLISDVPLGIFLSGGVDSSAVAALAVKATRAAGGLPGAIHTFNISFDEVDYDESRYAKAVADALRTTHVDIRLSEDIFRGQLDAALGSIDQPTFDHINSYFVSRAVREAGVTVALAGTGGDELFGGYRSFVDVPGARAWGRRLACVPEGMLRAMAGVVARFKAGGAVGGVRPQTRWGKLADVLAARGDLVGLYQLAYGLFTPALLRELRAGAADDGDDDVAYGLTMRDRAALRDMIAGQSPRHAVGMMELASFIGQRLMRDTDAASMAVALEVRVPLLDHVVVERGAAVDDAIRFDPPRKKMLLRQMALSELDPAIFDRPKSGFVLPIDAWCRRGLKERVRDTLMDRAACAAVGLDAATVARLWNAFEQEAPGIYWSRLWSLFVLLQWSAANGVRL